MILRITSLFFFAFSGTTWAQPAPQKMVPPPGKVIPEADRAALKKETAALAATIEELRGNSFATPLLPDVIVFHKAVDWALRYDEFMDAKQVAFAREQLAEGRARAESLKEKKAPWTSATGLIVRGFISRIDGSVQPYGLVVPKDWLPSQKGKRRLDIWNHGRGDTLTELAFIADRMKKPGEFTPDGAFVLHPYGRFCNATKFAGETDVFEAMNAVRTHYSIDPERVVLRGFSMGGASAWHLGVHHAGLWCAVNPGAGFAETAHYAGVFKEGKTPPPWWEQTLWRWYDADIKARNLFNVPVVAYSGELDKQKAAADRMGSAAAAEGVVLEHIIGPKTEHQYEPGAKKIVAEKIDALAAKGREALPAKVRFVTYTLRYHRMEWLEIDSLARHWERAEIAAEIVDEGTVKVTTRNIRAFTLRFERDPLPFDKTHPPRVIIDGVETIGPPVKAPWIASFSNTGGKWAAAATPAKPGLIKSHGLTGPIDDAFLDRFIFVRPTGKAQHTAIATWTQSELDRAISEWRRVFRGDAIVKDDRAITADDVQNANLVLWGDPSSNSVLARVLPQLPLKWTAETVSFGKYQLDAKHHAPALIYPNPLHSKRYIVLNSGFTFRMGSRTSNSLQTPKLPDWALIDLRVPPDDERPGLVYDAGFFDEDWRVR
jgi:pimeloyl-ACP methyl ester carboxylesterase